MAVSKQQITEQLKQINDPQLHRDLVTLNRVINVAVCEGYVNISLSNLGTNEQTRASLTEQVRQRVGSLDEQINQVNVEFVSVGRAAKASGTGPAASGRSASEDSGQDQAHGGAGSQTEDEQASPQDEARKNNPLPGVKHAIAVGAGKGGVGKSSVAVNVAIGLSRQGLKVGLLDGDIYGPSIPTMLGLDEMEPQGQAQSIEPFQAHGIKSMTLGKLVEAERPLIWRGPMAHSAFRQLLTQTNWGELDYLIIDLPPGTGDVPLTMAQLLPLTGAVVVCTPQRVAQDDARRAVRMFEQLGIDVLGIVENMSYFIGDDGKEYDIFGRGGAQVMAKQMDRPFLGTIPINMRLRANSDSGKPLGNYENDAQLAGELEAVVRALMQQVESASQAGGTQPTLNIH